MDDAPPRLTRPSTYLGSLNSAAFWAGVTTFIFMVFGALTIQLSVLGQFGISQSAQTSWITITWLTASLVSIPLSIYFRQPLAIGWSAPALIYLGSLSDQFTLAEVAAANLVAGVLILGIGVTGLAGWAVKLIPLPVLMGMFAASILSYEVRLVEATVNEAAIVAPMVLAFIVGHLLNHRHLPPVGLAVVIGAVAVALSGDVDSLDVESTVPTLSMPGFSLGLDALLTVSVPMVVFVLGLGNVQSFGFLLSQGYRPPMNLTTALVGVMTMVNSLFGGHPAAMARTVTAMLAGEHAGPFEARYWAGLVAMFGGLLVALATGVVVALIAIVPAAYVFGIAGLAILAPFQDALRRAFSSDLRLGPVVAFIVTLGTFEVAGIPAAFWGLVAGIGASIVLEWEQAKEYWDSSSRG